MYPLADYLVLAAFLGSLHVSCYAALGEERCTWGPSYWCKSQDTAKECGTIEYCIEKVWKTEFLIDGENQQPVEGELCKVCQKVVNFLKPYVDSNATKEEIERALERFCNLLPDINTTCLKFVDEYFPEVWSLLQIEFSDYKICQQLRLCKNAAIKQVMADYECILCEFVLKELDILLTKNATREEIEDALDKVCGLLPSTVTKLCVSFIKTFGSDILDLLVKELDPHRVCTTLKLCTQQQDRSLP